MEIVAIGIAFILAGIATELTGFGVATISMALLPFYFPLEVAVPLVAGISTLSTGVVAYRTKTKGLWKHMTSLVIGSVVGIPLGIYALNGFDEKILTSVLAVFLIAYSVYGFLEKQTFIKASTPKSISVGAVAGFSNALLSIHGPIVGLYASSNKTFTRNETRDIIATYMFFAGVFTVTGHFLNGSINEVVITNFIYSIPFLFIGLFIGSKIFSKLNEKTVRKCIYLFILVSGILILGSVI
jgi:uncharacterized membrane protein YfcA